MQQNENQYDTMDRRKKVLLLIAGLVILAAVILAVYLFTDQTDASTDEGGAVIITPDHIEQISDTVSDQVLDTLSKDILADMIRESISSQLQDGKIYELISDGDIKAVAIGDDELRALIAQLLAELEISGDSVLTDDQKKYIRLVVEQVLKDSLSTISVTQLLTDEEKRQLEEQLKKDLAQMMKNQIENSAYRLSDKDLERLKEDPGLERLITQIVGTVTKQQIEKLKEIILADIEKSIKIPAKGADYLTKDEVQSVLDKALSKVNKETLRQIESLTAKINEVKSSVNTLTKQIKELKAVDKTHAADLKKLQGVIKEIQESISHINSVTKELTSAINISAVQLEKVTGSGSKIQSAGVSAANLTIAEFVDVLAGNDRVYTGAIQELDRIINQLKEENTKKDEAFDKSLKELEGSLDENGRDLEKAKEELQKSDQEIKKNLDKQSEDHKKLLDEERSAREEADTELKSQIDETNKLIGDKEDAGKVEGSTIFEKIGSIIKILSADGIEGLVRALQNVGGAQTIEEGVDHLNTDLLDARERISILEKEKWYSDITLLADMQGNTAGYTYQENGAAYVYQIPLVTEEDQIDLSEEDTSIVVEFKRPDRLPSNVALTTRGNDLLISFTNRPTRNIQITTIHVYKEKR